MQNRTPSDPDAAAERHAPVYAPAPVPDDPDFAVRLCSVCGQMWRLEKIGVLNTEAPLFSPCCGAALEPLPAGGAQFPGEALMGIPQDILRAFYLEWNDPILGNRAKYPMFVEFIVHYGQ